MRQLAGAEGYVALLEQMAEDRLHRGTNVKPAVVRHVRTRPRRLHQSSAACSCGFELVAACSEKPER